MRFSAFSAFSARVRLTPPNPLRGRGLSQWVLLSGKPSAINRFVSRWGYSVACRRCVGQGEIEALHARAQSTRR